MEITYKTTKDIEPATLNALFEEIGWKGRGTGKCKKILLKSSFACSAWHGGKLVGFGRILEDGVMCMFYDIGVHPEYQGKGIGTEIMKRLINKVKNKGYVSIGLFGWEKNPESMKFYEELGFKRVHTGMELTRYMKRE